MTALAPVLEEFFTERLIRQLQASPQTITAYRDCFRLLLAFARDSTGKQPSALSIDDIDATLVTAFLTYLETDRGNSIRTRNARLAAIRSLFTYAALREPGHAALIARVLAIPPKRYDKALITWLTGEQVQALLEVPDRGTRTGRRDHALILTAAEAGLRVSELTALTCDDVHLGRGPYLRCHGKGRKERITPVSKTTAAILRDQITELGSDPASPLFPGPRGRPLTRSAVEHLLTRHAGRVPDLKTKTISPHVLRHTAAMRLLRGGADLSVIALWLGHESTETTRIYLHADMTLKEQALARTTPPGTPPGRYKPPDALLAFLENL